MSDIEVIENGAERFFTGLRVPDERPRVFARYADSVHPVLDWSTIKELATSKTRYMGRKRWPHTKNQGSRGSCNGYAGARATEEARDVRGAKLTLLSGEGLYAQINDGRDNGSGLQEGMEALVRTGVPPQEMVPHQEYRWSRISREAKEACSRFKIEEPLGVDTWQELCSGLAMGFVGVVAVHATNKFSQVDGNGVAGRSQGVGNHSVCVDDIVYIQGEPFVDMPNSWGQRWGRNGRAYLNWDLHLSKPNQYHDFYLIPTTTDDSEEENPPVPDGYVEPEPSPSSDVLVEMETSNGCGWCVKWKQTEQPKAKAAGWSVQHKTPTGPIPQFTVRVGGRSRVLPRGFKSFSDLQRVAKDLGA